MKGNTLKLGIVVLTLLALLAAYSLYPWLKTNAARTGRLMTWLRQSSRHPDWSVQAGEGCDAAPFVMPTSGYIGYLWGDMFRLGQRHQGIDIFGGTQPGETPVFAAYAGYLTRLPDWKSTVVIRIPSDPLQPERQIWAYYTHMAMPDGSSLITADFPPGTAEVFVERGAFLGYQGNYSGDPDNPVGVHLHFSIVLDGGVDAAHPTGQLLNELDIRNTLDPSPYLGLALNAASNPNTVPRCEK